MNNKAVRFIIIMLGAVILFCNTATRKHRVQPIRYIKIQ